jgi:GNAT superfamily N-acetyltransferase
MGHKIITVQIQAIDTSYAEELSRLAKNIYREYYLHLWLPGGAEWYMDEHAYDPAILKAELAHTNNLHFIVYNGGSAIGYLKLRVNATLSGYETYNCLEIERIYLQKSAAGKGTGRELMLLSEDIAKRHNKQLVFLKAMDSSVDAIGFYQKMGYQVCGSHMLPFPLMQEKYRGMVIMKKEIRS